MDSLFVPLQDVFLCGGVPALVTDMILDLVVHGFYVLFEVASLNKLQRTPVTFEFFGMFCRHVTLQSFLLVKVNTALFVHVVIIRLRVLCQFPQVFLHMLP